MDDHATWRAQRLERCALDFVDAANSVLEWNFKGLEESDESKVDLSRRIARLEGAIAPIRLFATPPTVAKLKNFYDLTASGEFKRVHDHRNREVLDIVLDALRRDIHGSEAPAASGGGT